MGWAFCVNQFGREVGYGVEAECDRPGCDEKIDRGLGYCCGGMHDGGEYGCGEYFCGSHLFMGHSSFLCQRCIDKWERRCAFIAGWKAHAAKPDQHIEIAYDEYEWADPDDECTGDEGCPAGKHLHGCFAEGISLEDFTA